jgi:hypothetical protein
MKGDFSRNTFDPSRHFSRVLMQQGRVLLDADWNEQAAILLHATRLLAVDLFGSHGGRGDGFKIDPASTSTDGNPDYFTIGAGFYYVDGIRCQCDAGGTYWKQPGYLNPLRLTEPRYLIYLDVWERHLSHVEQEVAGGISIRETALGGADTATRAQVIWQVRANEISADVSVACGEVGEGQVSWRNLIETWRALDPVPIGGGRLSARAKAQETAAAEDPCTIPPEARYRGSENQLYRVEVHRGGTAGSGATFKWSRENGSVVFPLCTLQGSVAVVEHLGADGRLGLHTGDWVELVDDRTELGNSAEDAPEAPDKPGRLLQVTAIDPIDLKVTLGLPDDNTRELPAYDEATAKRWHALLRRWDHQLGRSPAKAKPALGALAIEEKTTSGGKEVDNWLTLENGVQVQFERGGYYHTGDYWLIPARTVTRDVEWPQDDGKPAPQPPHGVEHHYAPLAIVTVDGNSVDVESRCRQLLTCATEIEPADAA